MLNKMIEKGSYYKHYKGEIYYIICEALMCNENNTQERYIVYKQIEKDQVYIRPISNFEEYVETEDGERLRRFKKVENNIPHIPQPIIPWINNPFYEMGDGIKVKTINNYSD